MPIYLSTTSYYLLKILHYLPCNQGVCTEWKTLTKEISSQRDHSNMKCHTHYVWKWLLCLAPSHRGTGGIGRWWHEWDPPLTVTMGTGPRVTSGNAQQSPSSSSTRRGKNLKRLGVTNNQDVSLSRDWHFHYASPQVRVSGQSMSMVPCFEGEKKKKKENYHQQLSHLPDVGSWCDGICTGV